MTTNNLHKYTILLAKHQDLDDFYNDMESPGGNLYIPNRRVDLALRRPFSRNTQYYLTHDEAKLVSQDPRVLFVRLTDDPNVEDILSTSPHPEDWVSWTSASDYFTKRKRTAPEEAYSPVEAIGITNWGLLRTAEIQNRDMWESGPSTIDPASPTKWYNAHALLQSKFGGHNIDMVIWDGIFDPNHPDFAVNPDGTGGTRAIQRDWYSRNTACGYPYTGPYPYVRNRFFTGFGFADVDLLNSASGQHGVHVASTAAGNRHGFAREANIYNIGFLSRDGFNWDQARDLLYDWHVNVKPAQGNNNLTVINLSAGSNAFVAYADIDYFMVNGSRVDDPRGGNTWALADFTLSRSIQLGISWQGQRRATGINFAVAYPDRQADIEDMISAGIYFVTAGGNDQNTIHAWDNDNRVVKKNTQFYYYNRGSFTSQNAIIVGNMDTTGQPRLHLTSARGAGVTVSAPGTDIWAASNVLADPSDKNFKFLPDYRNINYALRPETGTSMASPHVAGVVALILNEDPGLTPAAVKAKIMNDSAKGQLYINYGFSLSHPLAFAHNDGILTSSNIIISEFTPNSEIFRTKTISSGVTTLVPQAKSISLSFNSNPTNVGFIYRVALKDRADISIDIQVDNDSTNFPNVTYPATSTHGTPFSWSISGGTPGDTYFVWTKGAFRVRVPSTGGAVLDGSGSISYNNADWSTVQGGTANFGTITVIFYFGNGHIVTKQHTVSQ